VRNIGHCEVISCLIYSIVLRLEPSDKDAIKTKLFLLLQTEQYEAALTLIGAHEDQALLNFERSYSLYRLHREPEARDILADIRAKDNEDRGALHLEAQLVRPPILPLYDRF
jgi:signal recognition particle subunit SRP72